MGNMMINVHSSTGFAQANFTDDIGVINNATFDAETLTALWKDVVGEESTSVIHTTVDGYGFIIVDRPSYTTDLELSTFIINNIPSTTYSYDGVDITPSIALTSTLEVSGDGLAYNRKALRQIQWKAGPLLDLLQTSGWASEGSIQHLHVMNKVEG